MVNKKFIPKLLTTSAKNGIKSLVKQNDLLLSKYDNEGVPKKIIEKSNLILQYYYYLIENTDFKNKIIDDHNSEYIDEPELSKVMLSKGHVYNDPKTMKGANENRKHSYLEFLENSKSNDVVTKDFKDNKLALDDEILQKVSNWSNRIAHRLNDEISEVGKKMNFNPMLYPDDRTKVKKSPNRLKKEFSTEVYFAYKEFKNDKNLSCSIDEILKNIDNYNNNLALEKDENVKKMIKLIKKHYPDQKIDKEFLRQFTYCMNIEDSCLDFFEMKNISSKELIIMQERIKEKNIEKGEDIYEDQNIITFVVPDIKLTKDGKPTCRVVSLSKSEYDRYIKYNDSYSFSPAHIEMYAKKYHISVEEAKKLMQESVSGNKLTATERKALMAKCAVTSFHIPLDELNDFAAERGIKYLNREYPPLIECIAYSGTTLYDVVPSQEREKVVGKALSRQEKICAKNEAKFKNCADPERQFNKKNSIEDHIIQNINGRSK